MSILNGLAHSVELNDHIIPVNFASANRFNFAADPQSGFGSLSGVTRITCVNKNKFDAVTRLRVVLRSIGRIATNWVFASRFFVIFNDTHDFLNT